MFFVFVVAVAVMTVTVEYISQLFSFPSLRCARRLFRVFRPSHLIFYFNIYESELLSVPYPHAWRTGADPFPGGAKHAGA